MAMFFSIASDLYQAGTQDDGTPYIAELYYIVAEDVDGNRWRHEVNFKGCKVEGDRYEPHFIDTREQARTNARLLLNRINAPGSVLNMVHWIQMRPAYGSAAYIEYGQHDDWMEEQMGII